MPSAYVALGSNLGDRIANLSLARSLLPCVRASPLYETIPVDCPEGSAVFLNGVLELSWDGSAAELHALGQSIEAQLGRPPQHGYHAPRIIDVDLLAVGEMVIETPTLLLPHPRLHQRRFVLQPWADLSPHLRLPGFQYNIGELLERLDSSEPPLQRSPHPWNPL